jgi:hypothetical protein
VFLPFFQQGLCVSAVEVGLLEGVQPLAVRRKASMTEAMKI